jgi:hypothetical protein
MNIQDVAQAFLLEFHDGTHEVAVTYYTNDGVELLSVTRLSSHGARLVQLVPLPGADWQVISDSNVRRRFPCVAVIDMPL